MDIYFATFNCEKADIAKARRAFNQRFGNDSYREYISPYIRAGIMSIFNDPQTEHTKFFIETLAEFVNTRLGEKE